MHKKIFFSPMANTLSSRVKTAMMREDICHREPEFTKLLHDVRNKIKNIVKADSKFATIMFTGSGTAALDAVISSLPKKASVVIINNGTYGGRLVGIAKKYGLSFKELRFGGYPDLKKIEDAIKKEDITHLFLVHHETVLGLLNPLTEIGKLCKKYKKTFIVDAISSIVVEELDIIKDNVSFLVGSSNKGIGGAEGLSFVVAKNSELEKTKECGRSFYLDLDLNYQKQERGQTLFTPAVRVFSGLDEALDELEEEGVDNRINRFKELSKILRGSISDLGFNILTDMEHASNTVTLVDLGNRTYQELHNKLKEKGFVIYSGVDDETFRVCTFGDLHKKDIERFLKVLGEL